MSGIEWTDKVWNPVVGCTPVSSGCLNCYAAGMAVRLHGMTAKGRKVAGYGGDPLAVRRNGRAVFTGEVRCLEDKLGAPLRWRKPRKVFVNSMSDLFHESVPFEFIDRVFAVMALTPRHTYQVLTKRPERMAEYFSDTPQRAAVNRVYREVHHSRYAPKVASRGMIWPLPNVWLGTSVEDQAAADERVPHLLRCPAAVRWLSMEPLLWPVRLPIRPRHGGLDWLVVGGESGSNARPCDVEWIRDILGRAESVGVPVFVKQLGRVPVSVRASVSGFAGKPWRWDDSGECLFRQYRLRDSHGGDMDEWPMDLRVRQWPVGTT